ncbi:MAG TPA: SGNH/GDSL hydrolase family protein [Clostridium sp.]
MNNNKKGMAIIIILFLVFAGVLTLGVIKDKKYNSDNQADYNKYIEESKTAEVAAKTEEVKETPQEVLDFYGKLKNKKAVKVLVLGDGLALSQGSTSNSGVWDAGVVNLIQTTYGSTAELISLAKVGAASSVGLSVAKSNNLEGYDLVITCFGHNDNASAVNINDFKTNYTEIVKAIKEKSPKATILPILPSTLALDNKYRAKIQEVATENALTCIDTKTAFTKSGIAEAKLLNGNMPSNIGYQLYTQTIGEVIKAGVK